MGFQCSPNLRGSLVRSWEAMDKKRRKVAKWLTEDLQIGRRFR